MEDHYLMHLFLAFLLLLLSRPDIFSSYHSQILATADDRGVGPGQVQTYIVYVAKPEGTELLGAEELERWHHSFLPSTPLDTGEPRMVYSYTHAMSGFAARLTAEEAKAMEAKDGFLHAVPDKKRKLQTTYTPYFLGLSGFEGVWGGTNLGEGIIIGVIDSGIDASHPSFNDSMMPPPPLKWRGRCDVSSGFACNNKIIGAMGLRNGLRVPATDDLGHGTHVASTAAGNFVQEAEVLGMAKGVASGMAPKAHLAIYSVCSEHCNNSDIQAAIDQAIKDGVDVISMSIGGLPTGKYYDDIIAVGSLAATEKGIIACVAAGNDGPEINAVQNDAPWLLTVGASSTDRRIQATVKLGNGMELPGESIFQPRSFDSTTLLPMVNPGASNSDENAAYCIKDSLDHIDLHGKIVICRRGFANDTEKGEKIKAYGGAAMIVINLPFEGYTIEADINVLPAADVSFADGMKIVDYSIANSAPTATIVFNGTEFGARPSPAVASFSSRGPSLENGGILKPDVLAPGVNIIAASPFDVRGQNPSALDAKTFAFMTGTSMAVPHVSGIMALIKKVHPTWSPAAIQSAIITSAKDLDLDGNIIVDETYNTSDIFATGAGQVNPAGAMDPGLVYDRNHSDYIGYLCGIGYNDTEVRMIVRRTVRCSSVKPISAAQLNYPSISANLNSSITSLTIERTVTNVGLAREVYMPRIKEPTGVRVKLSRRRLKFSRVGEQKYFQVRLTIQRFHGSSNSSRGKLEWVSKKHVVGSPIAIRFA